MADDGRVQIAPLGAERARVVEDILTERDRQSTIGYDFEHDSGHYTNDWVVLLARYLGKLGDAADGMEQADYRRRLVQISAISMAGIESLDRAVLSG